MVELHRWPIILMKLVGQLSKVVSVIVLGYLISNDIFIFSIYLNMRCYGFWKNGKSIVILLGGASKWQVGHFLHLSLSMSTGHWVIYKNLELVYLIIILLTLAVDSEVTKLASVWIFSYIVYDQNLKPVCDVSSRQCNDLSKGEMTHLSLLDDFF